MDKKWYKNVYKLYDSEWTSEDIKKAFKNEMSEKQKNHINQNKKWLTKNHQEVTAKAVEK